MAGGGQDDLATVRDATAKYHDIDAAKAAGYITELPQTAAFGGGTCVANGSEGAMGIHMLDTRPDGRLDGTLDPANPEALLYEKRNDGTFKLTGVEYIVAQPPPCRGRSCTDSGSPTRTSPGSETRARTSGRCTRGSGSRTREGCSTPGTHASPAEDRQNVHGGRRTRGKVSGGPPCSWVSGSRRAGAPARTRRARRTGRHRARPRARPRRRARYRGA